MKNFLIILGFIVVFIAGYFVSQNYSFKIENKNTSIKPSQTVSPKPEEKISQSLVGNDKDEHGCIGSTGYT